MNDLATKSTKIKGEKVMDENTKRTETLEVLYEALQKEVKKDPITSDNVAALAEAIRALR